MVTSTVPGRLSRLRAERAEGSEDGSGSGTGSHRESDGGTAYGSDALPGDLFDPACPTRMVLDRVGDKWTALVVLLLSDGPLRFSQLRDRLGRVAPKVLTESLRRMERDGLVDRAVFAEVPPRVEYSLTDLGRSLIEPIAMIGDWAEVHVHRITAAQRAYDAARESR
jgi:DNA-binding HxlR family transcriptional regulator